MKAKKRLLFSIITLLFCLATFVGTTFAWFTDSVTSANNIIKAGNLDVEMYWATSLTSEWKNVETDDTPMFNNDRWEPGYTEVRYVKIKNAGSLAFKYSLAVIPNGKVGALADVIDVYHVVNPTTDLTSSDVASLPKVGVLKDVLGTHTGGGVLLPKGESKVGFYSGEIIVAIALRLPTTVDNYYQGSSVGNSFDIQIVATQFSYENDSFGDGYDNGAQFPAFGDEKQATATVQPTTDNKVPTGGVTLNNVEAKISALVPEGVLLDEGVDTLTLTVNKLDETSSNVILEDTEVLLPLDVHIEGVSKSNATPIIVNLGEIAPVGLNIGSYKLYHVEDGATSVMTAKNSIADLVDHNDFYYEPATGNVSLCLASFSEVTVVADTENAWEGKFDYSWYENPVIDENRIKTYSIANADQLAGFGAIVGGMKEGTQQNSFTGDIVKLLSDINLGDKESENKSSIIFYPIGYNSDDGKYEKTGVAVSTGFYSFMGTFDGNGHTVKNFYQNTWEMKGDHNWYDATLQYYRDGMGLFGRVYGGTVKNLTVKNFTSDGEIATTGVIAAYADGATFENISIFNCNPRVYNIGNGGIVGCVGWYAKEANLTTTFKNITVDNSNKISALWGSYDVACGGIVGQYYPTSGQTSADTPKNAGVHFENCHVSAQMDVYNDVCANYQYYAYRYTGMIIGSVRENETIDGHVYPKMDGITASGCTVHFGDWNDYYYCEIIDNTTASYTHDYQMSRLTEIKAIDGTTITYLDGTTGTVPASGRANYVIVDYTKGHGTNNATCYHFKDGVVWTHDMGGIQTGIDENGDGQDDLKEDKQHIYLEFNNLVTGYGWGVTSKGVDDLDGVTILDRVEGNSVEKFEGNVDELTNNMEYKLGDIFKFVDNGVALVEESLTISITNKDTEKNPVSATITYDRVDWGNSTISFAGCGDISITIQDYYFCIPTTIDVNISDREPEVKFKSKFTGDFLYRVGNANTVSLGSLFEAKDGVTIGTVTATVEKISGNATGTYTPNTTDWTVGTIQFSNTGVVKVTITDNDYCTPTTIYLEVIAAVNATTATNATENNVVLLQDIGSGFTVSGEYTVFGNGFTLNYTGNGQYLNNGLRQGIITVSENGRLDNLRIKASIYPAAYMYYGATSVGEYVQGGPSSVEGDKTRYHYQLSAVVAKDNATISNCYIYGGRTNIFVDTGNVTIQDTILECGVVANVQIQSSSEYTVTLKNVTTIQYRVNATIVDTTKVMLGAGVIVGPDTETNPNIILNGYFKQYNWVTEEDKTAVTSDTAEMLIGGALDATAYNHTINGKTASNLGIIYMNNVEAQVENKTGLPYVLGDVSMSGVNGKVYSLQNATESQIYSDCENADRYTINGDYIPTFIFDLADQEISYDGSEDTRYLYGDKNGIEALYKDGEDPITLDLTKLATIYKYESISYDVTVTCKDSSGNTLSANNGVVTLVAQGSYTIVFTVQDNIFYNKNGETVDKSVVRTYSVPLTLTVKEADIENAIVSITKTALDGVYTTVNLTDYKLRINFLDCISITDYDNTGNGTTVDLTSNISTATLTPSGVNVFTTASTVTVTYTDGRVLTVNISNISGSSPGTKTALINTSGGLYFITEGALNDKPTEASSQNKCTITSVSYKGNSGSTVTNDTDVTVTWALGSSGTTECITPDTLITLADGTQKRVDALDGTEELLVYSLETGKLESAPIMFIDSDPASEYEVVKLVFADGTEVKTIYEHGFWDYNLNEYVYVRADNYNDYVGHYFAKQNGDELAKVQLVNVVVETEVTMAYSPVTKGHLCYFVNGVLSMPGGVAGLFNIFEVDSETMTYDFEAMQRDIETYGLFTYEELNSIVELPESMFNEAGGAYLKISIAKGRMTMDELIAMVKRYTKYF